MSKPFKSDAVDLAALPASPVPAGEGGFYHKSTTGLPVWVKPDATEIPIPVPDQTGNSGKFLSTNGIVPSWATPAGGGLPALSGLDGAVLRETEPGASLSFARLTFDDIDPAFAITGFSPGFATLKELGDSIVDPSFTASYNAALSSATLNETDTPGPIGLLSPFTAFAYGTPPLPSRTYVKTAINASVTWTLAATKIAGPTKMSSVGAAWRPRVFYQEKVPAAFTEAFIESLTGQALAGGLGRTIAYGAGGGTKKLYYCFPTAFGAPTSFKDADTNFAIPFTKVASAVAVTNAFSVVVPGGYDVWESDFFLIAAVNVVVA